MATTLLAVALSGCGGSEGPAAATPVANEPAAIDAARHPAGAAVMRPMSEARVDSNVKPITSN